MANKRRTFKVAERVRTVVALELQRMADPRFSLVTVSSAVASSDLRQAKIYWTVSMPSPERIAAVTAAFKSAAGAFRRALAQELQLRYVPNLLFFYDTTLDERENIEKLLARANGRAVEDNVPDEQAEEPDLSAELGSEPPPVSSKSE